MSNNKELANNLIDLIMSHEDSLNSTVSLHLKDESEPNIYFKHPKTLLDIPLFLWCETNDGSSLFTLKAEVTLSSIFIMLSRPEEFNIYSTFIDHFISNIAWFKLFTSKMKAALGNSVFNEISHSPLSDFSLKVTENDYIVQLNFSKYSNFLHKDVNFKILFDSSFKFIDIDFVSYTYADNAQSQKLSMFSKNNKLTAFYVLFHYYTNVDMHNNLVSMMDIDNDLNDENLSMCSNIISMNTI